MSPTDHPDAKARHLAERAALHPHPERVSDALFHGVPFFDPRDLIQVRYEMVRRCRVDGQPPAQVARAFGASRQLLYLLSRAFQAEGLPGLFPRKRGPRAAHKCTDEVMAFVLLRRSQAPQLTLAELLSEVEQHHGTQLHPRTLERHLLALGKKLHRCRPSMERHLRPLTWPHATNGCGPASSCVARPTPTRPPW